MRVLMRGWPGSRAGSIRKRIGAAACASVLLALAACGGGGGGSDPPAEPADPPPDPPPANEAPSVSAGDDQTIEMPFAATLAGSATDDDAGSTLTYTWSGPAGVTFADASAASTEATFSAAGSYELTLSVSDGSETGSDSLLVTVDPAVYPAADDDTDTTNFGWLRITPAEAGMNEDLLNEAATYAQSRPTFAGSGVIVRRGRIVFSWGDIDQRYEVKSTTKSMGGIALGLALDEGRLALEDQAQTHLPSIGVPPDENSTTGWLPQITILQLATHTAGFDFEGDYQELLFEPGTTWSYSDSGINWLADLLTHVYAQDLHALLTERLWSKLGVTADDIRWRAMVDGFRPDSRPSGIEHRELASGISANVQTMARVGLLFLRNGVWGEERIVSESFVETVQTPRPEIAGAQNPKEAEFPGATGDYGVLWWTNETGQMASVPTDTYWGWGLGDSVLVVIPSLDLVIARAGPQDPGPNPERIWNGSRWNGEYRILTPFLDPIVASVEP